MSETVIYVGKLLTPFLVLERVSIRVKGGVIVSIEDGYVASSSVLDYRDYIAIPGLVDTHIHGIAGYDTNSGKTSDILGMSRALVRYGVTSFIPTSVTAPHDKLLEIAQAVANAQEVWMENKPKEGARILGLHLEGPYISMEKRGAQNPQYIRSASIDEVLEYWRASRGMLRILTLAPEVDGALELIPLLRTLGVSVSIGHTNADYETAKRAIARGANRATHIFNAMRGIHHREPGPIIALLEAPSVYVELIADFVHLHPATVKFVIDHVGYRRCVLITDAISATGLPDGRYSLGGLEVIVKDGIARLTNGALAGSTLTLDRAVRNIASLGYDLRHAVAMASHVPIRSIEYPMLGKVEPGYIADITILDNELRVVATIIEGEEVYRSRSL